MRKSNQLVEDTEDSELLFLRELVKEQQYTINRLIDKNHGFIPTEELGRQVITEDEQKQMEFQKLVNKKNQISRGNLRSLREEIQRRADAKLKARAIVDSDGKVHIE